MTQPVDVLTRAMDLLASQPAQPLGSGITGAVGDALFAHAVRAAGGGAAPEPWLARAWSDAREQRRHPALHLGKAGAGFVQAVYGADDAGLAELDGELLASLEPMPVASVQSGVAGIGLYASLRSASESGRELQRAVVSRLRASAVPAYGGVVWHTPADYARCRGVEVPATPVTEFGMIHGMGGTLAALTALAVQGCDDAELLARAALTALWNRMAEGTNHFGRILFGDPGATTSFEFLHHRWCVGDVGVLRACYVAASALGDSDSARRAHELLRAGAEPRLTGRLPGEPGRLDLCCGAASFAQVYWRMHRETGDPVFGAVHARIVNAILRLLDRLRPSSFLFGRMGMLLAVLSPVTEVDPVWDGILGISLPRAARAASGHAGWRAA
jgi:hypothetical protein